MPGLRCQKLQACCFRREQGSVAWQQVLVFMEQASKFLNRPEQLGFHETSNHALQSAFLWDGSWSLACSQLSSCQGLRWKKSCTVSTALYYLTTATTKNEQLRSRVWVNPRDLAEPHFSLRSHNHDKPAACNQFRVEASTQNPLKEALIGTLNEPSTLNPLKERTPYRNP